MTEDTAAIDEDKLVRESAEIEHLLEDLHALVAEPVWQRIQELLGRVVRLYGQGLAHALLDARAAGADPDALAAVVSADQLLASLLVLHGLHPHELERRIATALEAVRVELGAGEDDLAVAELTDDTVVVRARPGVGGGAMSPQLVESVVRRALECAAPELAAIHVEGLARVPRDLVQIRPRSRAS